MEKSKVYFTDFRVQVGVSLLQKLKTLCLVAGIKKIDMEGKFVAIKMHFGELGNMAFLRPQYAKVVADLPLPDRLQYPLSRQPPACTGTYGLRQPERFQSHHDGLPDYYRRRSAGHGRNRGSG